MPTDARRFRRLFWMLVPVIVGFGVLMALAQSGDTSWTRTGTLVEIGLFAAIVVLMLKLWNPDRFGWAGRALAGLVLVAYLAYFVSESMDPHAKLQILEPQAHASLRNASIGLVLYGGISLWYICTGRLPWQQAASPEQPSAPEA